MDEKKELRVCGCCGAEVERSEMRYTKDCHGIIYRLVCGECFHRLMAKGYDGRYYEL